MQFTLITPKGKIYTFYLEAVALCFQQAYGGTLINKKVLQTETA
jgi:hypothetical protein